MSGNIQEFAFSVLLPVYFFGGIAGLITFVLYKVFPNPEHFLKEHGFDLGLFDEAEKNNLSGSLSHLPLHKGGIKKLPVVREHKQATRIYTNGKFENPTMDYNTEKRELQEV